MCRARTMCGEKERGGSRSKIRKKDVGKNQGNNPFSLSPDSSTSTSHPRSQRQIPGQARSVVEILRVEAQSSKPIPCAGSIDQRQVRIQNPPPAPGYIVDGIEAAVAEIRVPLLGHEVLVPDVTA